MNKNKSPLNSIGKLLVHCDNDSIDVVSGYMLIDSIIDEVGFANVYDEETGRPLIVSKDPAGKLIQVGDSYWPAATTDFNINDDDNTN